MSRCAARSTGSPGPETQRQTRGRRRVKRLGAGNYGTEIDTHGGRAMTQTQLLPKRMTRTMPPPYTDARSGRAPRPCGSHAADLAHTLRSLALRAHQAVKDQVG